ncbi:hypothetical protein [Bacillus pinisoli]|nr:hypothetical protein [Bacillus pinisoli]
MEAVDWKLISFLVLTIWQEHELRFKRQAHSFWVNLKYNRIKG